jgi:CMP-N-acetylneuraminic acid synthetase
MEQFKEIVALVPMRHHSQRVPGKNYRLLAGKPLFHHILITLRRCSEISRIAVDTDSPPVMDGIRQHFPDVMIIERPKHLCADDISMNEILLFDTSQVKADLYLQTHSTNPLLRSQTISDAIRTLAENYPQYDSMFSVTRLQTRLWDANGRPLNHDPDILLQTQDLPPVYEENSCFYLFTAPNLRARRNRLGQHPFMYEIDADEAWDIDEALDFLITDTLLSNRSLDNQSN